MCGLVGLINIESTGSALRRPVAAMTKLIEHRGPDGEGIWADNEVGLCLGHRRLAIIDPEHGKQPLETADGRLVIVFNGEVYNYLELRRELIQKGHPIHSYSDTEVLLYAYLEWGDACVDRLMGMFAFAIWDKKERRLFCARDRVGIKPFYYYFDGKILAIASEIKSLFASGLVKAEPNPEGLQDYRTFQFCLGEKTMFQGIKKLEPGWSMTVQYTPENLTLKKHQYWDVAYNINESHDERWFVDHLAALIEDSVRMHLRSDVSIGAHLSGGLDSSTLVCLASGMLTGEKLKTFTGAFSEGERFDETRYAKLVAESAQADYRETYISGSDFPGIFSKLMYYMDEPAAGAGLIPQYYVSQLASKDVKVVLGGQGGDEIFVGYARYFVASLEQCLADSINNTSSGGLNLSSIIPNLPLLQAYKPMLKGFWQKGVFDSWDERYFQLIDRSGSVANLYSNSLSSSDYSSFASFQEVFNRPGINSFVDKMGYFDLKGSLPALLQVEDRTSMAASIESRVPLLDHRIIEFMATVPDHIKFKNGNMKHLFKGVVENILPKAIFDRQDKMGFPTPLEKWIKGESRQFVHDTLLSDQARSRGIYDMKQVEQAINNEHEFGRVVWGLLCMETWHRTFIDQDQNIAMHAA